MASYIFTSGLFVVFFGLKLVAWYACKEYVGEKNKGSVEEFTDLFDYIVNELHDYRSHETFDREQVDKTLVGLMTLLSVLLSHHEPFRKLANVASSNRTGYIACWIFFNIF